MVVCDVGGQCYTPHEIDAITYDNSMPRRYFNSVGTNCDTVEQGMTSRILGKSGGLFCFVLSSGFGEEILGTLPL